MSNKAPSAGTKVTKGVERPIHTENPGPVPAESLAAESARKGGAFAANPGQGQGEQAPQKRQPEKSSTHKKTGGTEEGGTAANKTTSLGLENQQTGRGTTGESGGSDYGKPATSLNLENQSAYGGPAPSYVTAQRHRDPGGPHGKNLHEGGFEGSGTAGDPLPEPGSKDDPARVAERDLEAKMFSQGRDAGPRQTQTEGGGGAGGKTWFSPLGGDEEA